MKNHRMSWVAVALAVALVARAAAAQGPVPTTPMNARIDSGFLIFQSADGAFKYWLDGRLQVDGALYRGGKNHLASGTEIRRGRIGIKTVMYTNWEGEIDIDFADNAVEMKDMWVGYAGFTNSFVRIGNFKEPFSLETLTSSKYITFMERSYADNFSPDRNIGVSYTRWGKQWYASVGAFGQPAGDVDETAASEAYAFTGRVTFAPVMEDRMLVHIGGAASHRTPNAALPADANQVRFRARPETDISQARFLTTGKIKNTDYTNYWNGEFATVLGSGSVQAEYTRVDVHRLGERPTAKFYAGYVTASYFLTGESRKYIVADGEFDRVYPNSPNGAWEIAARYSGMDLNDPSPGVAILGGKAANVTVGLNWYINPNFKWMFNYVRVVTDKNAKPDLGTNPQTGDKFNIFQMRFALAL